MIAAPKSAVCAARFRSSYHGTGLPPPDRDAAYKAERWAWFRIAALDACRSWPRTSAALAELLELDERARRTQLANQRRMVNGGFLARESDGYRTTPRGLRVLDDLRFLETL